MEHEIPPGYVPWGEQGMMLVDPTECPVGHRWGEPGWQRRHEPCPIHNGHPSWRCHCGRELFLRKEDGAIVEQLDCVSGPTRKR